MGDIKKNTAICYVRFLAMCMIIACHFFQYYDNELAFWFNVGVQIFFVISGFLYGAKDIENPIEFIVKQFKKILIPYYIFLFLISLLFLGFAREQFDCLNVVKAFFCVGTIDGLGHLWFVGYILVCYLITPYLYWLRKKTEEYSVIKATVIYAFVCFLIVVVGTLTDQYFKPYRICCYIVGFMIAAYYKKYGNSALKVFRIVVGIFALLLTSLRIYLKYIYKISPETIYGKAFFSIETYLHLLLGVALFLWLYFAFKKARTCSLIRWSDKYSYCVYIVHQTFILSPFSTMELTKIKPLDWTITLVLIILSGVVLYYITEFFTGKFKPGDVYENRNGRIRNKA